MSQHYVVPNIYDAGKFCQDCGTKLALPDLFCPKCFVPLENNPRFCPECGTKLQQAT